MSAEYPTHADLYHEIGELKRDIGGIKEGIANIKDDAKALSADVKLLVSNDAERRGKAKVMAWVAGVSGGGISAIITKLLTTGRLF